MYLTFANAKATHIFFSKNISIKLYAIFHDKSLNNMLTKNIISFQQLGPGCLTNNVEPDQMYQLIWAQLFKVSLA